MIETRISTYERGRMLNDMDSGNILNALGYKDVSRIEAAFSLGIAPLANAMQISSGVILIHNYVTQFINLHNWEHLKATPRTLNPHAFQLMDVFLNARALFNQRTIINAAGSGNKDYIAHVLQKWTQRHHYISVCLISPTAIHNAFMWRDWELVEMLLESCKRWWKLNGTTFHSLEDVTLALSDGEMIEHDLSTYVPFPMKPNDTYYFKKVPFLVKLGVYPEYVYTKALEELAYYSLDWDQDLAIACAEDLIKAGAEVTHQAIYNASVSENHDWNLTTPRLKYLLDKYEVRPGVEFLSFMDFAAAAQQEGVSETIRLILAKGVPVTMDVLLFVFRNEFVSTPSDATRAIFAAINSNNFLLRNFLDQLEANLEFDIPQEELPFYEELFTYLQSLGFRTTQNIVDRAEINNKPLLAGLFKIMIEE
ncbi:hypothetical protein HDU79_010814 [Rhizoclosmatium sp. JEL0117]|nr:hypothetical protein HDU79_010814 [Rhizoclosmatium sp. JEL0117]